MQTAQGVQREQRSDEVDLDSLSDVVIGLVKKAHLPPITSRHDADSPLATFFANGSGDEGDSVVAVLGPRGSGKTTTLFRTCERLLNEGSAIVMPVIRPEAFRVSGSLAGVVVGLLVDLIETVAPGELTSEFFALRQDALKAAALAPSSARELLTRSTETLSQYTLDAIGLAQHQNELPRVLGRLAHEARVAVGAEALAPIVIPVDDIDLLPVQLVEILADLRLISSVPGLVPLVCASRADLKAHLQADLVRTYGAREENASQLADQQLHKLLRRSRSLQMPYLDHIRRIGFVPLGRGKTLSRLLHEVIELLGGDESPSRQLQDWVEDSVGPEAWKSDSALAWLPETPRELEDLWLVANELVEAVTGEDASNLRVWLSEFCGRFAANANFTYTLDVSSVDFTNGVPQVLAATRWSNSEINLFPVPIGPWLTVAETGSVRLRTREFSRPDGTAGKTRGDNETVIELHPTAVSAILFMQDFFRLKAFSSLPVTVPGFLGASDYDRLQSVRMLGVETDDVFFHLPYAKGGVAALRSRECWNEILNRSGGAAAVSGQNVLSEVCTRFVHVVVATWLDGRQATAVIPTFDQALESACERYRSLVRTAGARPRARYSLESAYCSWFVMDLPLLLHDLLLPGVDLDAAVRRWMVAVATRPCC